MAATGGAAAAAAAAAARVAAASEANKDAVLGLRPSGQPRRCTQLAEVGWAHAMCGVVRGRGGQGCGIVEFETAESAAEAINTLHQSEVRPCLFQRLVRF